MRNTVQLLIPTTIPGCILLRILRKYCYTYDLVYDLLLPPQPAVRQRKLSRAGAAPAAHLPSDCLQWGATKASSTHYKDSLTQGQTGHRDGTHMW